MLWKTTQRANLISRFEKRPKILVKKLFQTHKFRQQNNTVPNMKYLYYKE